MREKTIRFKLLIEVSILEVCLFKLLRKKSGKTGEPKKDCKDDESLF